jgi:hypothetical protein
MQLDRRHECLDIVPARPAGPLGITQNLAAASGEQALGRVAVKAAAFTGAAAASAALPTKPIKHQQRNKIFTQMNSPTIVASHFYGERQVNRLFGSAAHETPLALLFVERS